MFWPVLGLFCVCFSGVLYIFSILLHVFSMFLACFLHIFGMVLYVFGMFLVCFRRGTHGYRRWAGRGRGAAGAAPPGRAPTPGSRAAPHSGRTRHRAPPPALPRTSKNQSPPVTTSHPCRCPPGCWLNPPSAPSNLSGLPVSSQ